MKLTLSILLSLLSLNLFAADGALGTASGTTTVGTIPAGNLPALGVAYPNALTNNSTVAWTNTDNITALTFSGAGSGQGILQLSNAAATGLTVVLGPSNAFANVAFFSNSIVAPFWKDPTNSPTSNYVLTATSTVGDSAWKAVAASSVGYELFEGFISPSFLNIDTTTRYIQPNGQVSSTTESTVSTATGNKTMVLTNWFIKLNSSAPSAGTNVTFTIMTNGVASNFAITYVGGGAAIQSNIVDSVPVPLTGTWSIRVVGTNPSIFTSNVRWNFGILFP